MRAFLTHFGRSLVLTSLLMFGCSEEEPMTPCIKGDGTFRYQIDENSPVGALVGKIEVESMDQMRFYIHTGNINNTFNINLFDGRIFVNNSMLLDYETNPEFNLTVMAKSPYCTTSIIMITIQVSDLRE